MSLSKFCNEKSFKLASSGAGVGIIIAIIMILQPGIDANADDISKMSDKFNELDKTVAIGNERFIQIAKNQEETKKNTKIMYEKIELLYIAVCSNSDFNC